MKKPELVAPAGDFEKLKVAFHFGADAVYVGLENFSLRAKTKNFSGDELSLAVQYTHRLNKKIYVALNIYFTPDDMSGLINYLKLLENLKPDGIILSDMGALYLAKEHAPSLNIHISTQANTTNQYAAKFYKDLGVKRIVLARELSLKDISEFKDAGIELEAFVHGAMCIAYSGRCLLSSYMTTKSLGAKKDSNDEARSANKGDCAHSCRWEYALKEINRPDENFIAEENKDGTYIFSSKDICMIEHIAPLVDAGVRCFKIEGRMKSILYISSIVRAYRSAIDHWAGEDNNFSIENIKSELDVVSHREFCTGYFFDDPKENANTTKGGMYQRKIRLAALVEGSIDGKARIKIYNTMQENFRYEYIAPDMNTFKIGRIEFYNTAGERIDKVNHSEEAFIIIWDKDGNKINPQVLDIIRMEADF